VKTLASFRAILSILRNPSPGRTIAIALAASMLPVALVEAQSQSSDTLPRAGEKALVFSANGLPLGGGLGGKYWIDETGVPALQRHIRPAALGAVVREEPRPF